MKILRVEAPAKRYIKSDGDGETYRRVIADLDNCHELFEEKFRNYQRNLRYYQGKHWTETEKAAFHSQFRHHYSFNEIQNKIEHLVGSQMQTRLDARAQPREQGDQEQAELLNLLLHWTEQVNDLEYTESECFKDALIAGAGAVLVRWEPGGVAGGYPRVERVPVYELFWDPDSTTIDLSDAQWMCRVTAMTKARAAEMYPQFAASIDKAGITSHADPWYYSFATERRRQGQSAHSSFGRASGREFIRIVEHWERVKTFKYIVEDQLTGRERRFDTRREAVDYAEGLSEAYLEAGELLVNPDGTDKILLVTSSRDQIIQTIIIGTELVHRALTVLPTFPYVVDFAFFHDGDYWAFVDQLIDPQIMVNRYLTQFDYQLGTSMKSAISVMESLLKRGFTIEDVRREMSKTSPVFPVLNHEAIRERQGPNPDASLFQGIELAIGRILAFSGGANAVGLTENAAESGRAVLHRQYAANIGRLPLFDHLRLWRRNLTMQLIWYIKNFMGPEQIRRIIGLSAEAVQLDDGLLDTLGEIETDVFVDEIAKSESAREQQYEQAKELFQVIGAPPELVMPTMIELSNLPSSKKKQLLEQVNFFKQYQEEQAQLAQEQKMQEQVETSLRKRELKERREAELGLGLGLEDNQKDNAEFAEQLHAEVRDEVLKQFNIRTHGLPPSAKFQYLGGHGSPEEYADSQAKSIIAQMGRPPGKG